MYKYIHVCQISNTSTCNSVADTIIITHDYENPIFKKVTSVDIIIYTGLLPGLLQGGGKLPL